MVEYLKFKYNFKDKNILGGNLGNYTPVNTTIIDRVRQYMYSYKKNPFLSPMCPLIYLIAQLFSFIFY